VRRSRAPAHGSSGSGAIALAIAKARPRAKLVATDASNAALEVAHVNAARLAIDNVEFCQGDWCVPLGDARFDVIVSNPPYVAEGDPHLHEGDLRFEPAAALASGDDGLDAIRIIIRDARAHLHEGGWLMFEHGFDQGADVRDLLLNHGYAEVFTRQDLEGRERVSGGRT
jgi:release factor glutamine methyltransferase